MKREYGPRNGRCRPVECSGLSACASAASDAENGRGCRMFRDYTLVLWLLKLGGLINLYFLVKTSLLASRDTDSYVVLPGQILFAVSAYRCFFPVRYEHNVVFHDSIFSSIFVTRLLATCSEIAYIFLFSHVLRLFNIDHVEWVIALSWLMVVQVVISQCFVWAAILTEQLDFYCYEELGWALIFVANTVASAYLYFTVGTLAGREVLLRLNLLFGIVYLPWQVIHLTSLRANARRNSGKRGENSTSISRRLAAGLKRALRVKTRRTDPDSWGGLIGLTWMTSYWATLIPMWVYCIVKVLCPQ
jgi:hypothetical protein